MEVESIALIHKDERGSRRVIGQAQAVTEPDGNMTLYIRLDPQYEYLQDHYRRHVNAYLGLDRKWI